MKTVFMGTSEFAVPVLQKLHDSGFAIQAVVTQPDRRKGRGRHLAFSPVKEMALQLGLLVLQPVRLRAPESVEEIRVLEPDLIVVASYGQLVPPAILQMPPRGCINLHSSLLPAYRGAAPIQRAIMNGETQTGVTVMLMDESLDTGDILSQVAIAIGDDEDGGCLEHRLALAGAELLVETINGWCRGEISPVKQDDSRASYAAMLSSDEEAIDWSWPAARIVAHIRALSPRPGAYTVLDGKRLKIYRARPVKLSTGGEGIPGQVLQAGSEGILVRAGEDGVSILEAQREGKKRMAVSELVKGSGFRTSQVLG